jgi:hypothetical protein
MLDDPTRSLVATDVFHDLFVQRDVRPIYLFE